MNRTKAIAAAALLALCLASPALAATDADRSDAAKWVFPVVDEPAPLRSIDPPQALPEPPKPSLPPPGDVLDAVSVLRQSCPEWQIGTTPAYETEAHVCELLAGHDHAYDQGAFEASSITAAFLFCFWVLTRLPAWIRSILALVWTIRADLAASRQARTTP
jgi:hypothetical protein